MAIETCGLPEAALLKRYRDGDGYTDCYFVDIPDRVSQTEYVTAFYTTWVFKLERWLLKWLVSRPSSDLQARALAAGELDAFAAWTVEARASDQLLLCDFHGRTRSWLMSSVVPERQGTRLFFGSAVVPGSRKATGQARMGLAFTALLGFHRLYSRILLRAAARRLARRSA